MAVLKPSLLLERGVGFLIARADDGSFSVAAGELSQGGFASYRDLETFIWNALVAAGHFRAA